MKDVLQISFAVIFAAIECPIAIARTPQLPAEETLCIHLYDLAPVPPGTLKWAISLAAGVFTRAGIRTRWEQPSTDSWEAHSIDLNTSAVNLSRSGNRSCLVVRLVQDLQPADYPGALGFALPLARFGPNTEILYRRIEFEAACVGTDPYILLAYTMAHEIGHVLLRSSVHAPAGIMQAHPGSETWRLAKLGMIAFLPNEAMQMRRELGRYRAQHDQKDGTASKVALNRFPSND